MSPEGATSPEEAQEVVDRLVERAKPGEQLEAVFGFTKSTEVRAHGGEVEHFESGVEVGVGVRIIEGGRTGLSWVGVLDHDALAACVEEARDNARFATVDPNGGLAEPDGVGFTHLDTVDPTLADVDPADKVRFAKGLDARIMGADPRITGHEGADYSDSVSVAAVASTTGVRAVERATSASAAVYALASDGQETTSGFGLTFGRGFGVLDPEEVIDAAVMRATSMLGARKADSSRLTVVLDAYVTSQFLGAISSMLSGDSVVRGRTPFAERVGEMIASPLLSLHDHPHDPDSVTAASVDGEGLATRRVPLIESGRLGGFLHNAYTARTTGTHSTGSAVRAGHRSVPAVGTFQLTPEPGSRGAAELVAEVDRGVLVREVSGVHSGINPISGDVSVGIEGHLIRRGELAEPVREVTIGSTVQRMLGNITAVGSDLQRFPWESAGLTLAIADVTLSGN